MAKPCHVIVKRIHAYYAFIRQKKTGVNWVKCLPKYMQCLNHEKREELGWKKVFEIYFERKVNELINEGLTLGNQRFPVRVWLEAICRGELSAVIARVMSKYL